MPSLRLSFSVRLFLSSQVSASWSLSPISSFVTCWFYHFSGYLVFQMVCILHIYSVFLHHVYKLHHDKVLVSLSVWFCFIYKWLFGYLTPGECHKYSVKKFTFIVVIYYYLLHAVLSLWGNRAYNHSPQSQIFTIWDNKCRKNHNVGSWVLWKRKYTGHSGNLLMYYTEMSQVKKGVRSVWIDVPSTKNNIEEGVTQDK